MKNIIGKILFIIFLTIFISCQSVRRFEIEIQEPATITLPVSAQNILILNNAVPQSADLGIELKWNGRPVEQKPKLTLDSTLWWTIFSLSDKLKESDFLDEIFIYRDSIRTNKDWMVITPLPKEIQDEFYEREDYDALITIDRLLYVIDEDVKGAASVQSISEKWLTVDAKANAILTCSIYLYGNEKPFKSFTISDSLLIKSPVYSDSVGIFNYLQEYFVNNLALTLGEKAASYIVPTWKTVERIIHTDYQARMKEAYSYSQAQKWEKAESLWETEYEKKNKSVEKAKIALNLAVANEMQDKFESAISWANKAEQHFLEDRNSSQYAEEITFISQYILELQKRIQHNLLLDMQWGRR
ncbi:hypothetical protein FACS189432_05590 [Bacteroidia bacterium]|nr:hypothetical protein FACS189426_21040 [Bacteroidia bacterium]GHT28104.1 hypothetical protein FACS189432_05590 [Bacteroidia bacterium]